MENTNIFQVLAGRATQSVPQLSTKKIKSLQDDDDVLRTVSAGDVDNLHGARVSVKQRTTSSTFESSSSRSSNQNTLIHRNIRSISSKLPSSVSSSASTDSSGKQLHISEALESVQGTESLISSSSGVDASSTLISRKLSQWSGRTMSDSLPVVPQLTITEKNILEVLMCFIGISVGERLELVKEDDWGSLVC